MSSSASLKIGVMIVEDQTAIRQMLGMFVNAMPDYRVVGEAGNVEDALAVAAATRPQVVILDWMLLSGLGLDFLRSVRIDPPPRVLVFSANTTDLAIRDSLAAGALGYLEKTADYSEFTIALRTVAAGGRYLSPTLTRKMTRPEKRFGESKPGAELSPRERDVLRWVAEGLSSKQIADLLRLSVRTVENHRANITRRSGLRSAAQLALYAVRLGLIEAVPENA